MFGRQKERGTEKSSIDTLRFASSVVGKKIKNTFPK